MNRFFLFAAFALAFASGTRAQDGKADPYPGTLPATLEGRLVIEVPAADVDNNETDSNYGTLTVGSQEYAVDVPTPVLDAAQLPDDGADVRATFVEADDSFGLPYPIYRIGKLERR
jgi:hypothetical protein